MNCLPFLVSKKWEAVHRSPSASCLLLNLYPKSDHVQRPYASKLKW